MHAPTVNPQRLLIANEEISRLEESLNRHDPARSAFKAAYYWPQGGRMRLSPLF